MCLLKMSTESLFLQANLFSDLNPIVAFVFILVLLIAIKLTVYFSNQRRIYQFGQASMYGRMMTRGAKPGAPASTQQKGGISAIMWVLVAVATALILSLVSPQSNLEANNREDGPYTKVDKHPRTSSLGTFIPKPTKEKEQSTQEQEPTGTLEEAIDRELYGENAPSAPRSLSPLYSIIGFQSTDYQSLRTFAKSLVKQYPGVSIYIYEGVKSNYILLGEYFGKEDLRNDLNKYRAELNEKAFAIAVKDLNKDFLYLVSPPLTP